MNSKNRRNFIIFKPKQSIGTLEKLVAEKDDNLEEYYVGEDHFVKRALDRNDDASVFVGPKGVGKSAILQMVRIKQKESGDDKRVIEIAPDDLAFNSLINVKSTTPLLENTSRDQWLFKTLWDYVLSVEIIKREKNEYSSVKAFLEKLYGNQYKKEQSRLLKVTLNDDGSQTSMTDRMLALFEEISGTGKYGDGSATLKIRKSQTPGATDDLHLLQLVNNVAKSLPSNIDNEYYILIDDLDLHWTGSELQNTFLGAMFFSIWKMSHSSKIKFVVSLRKNIYQQIQLEERDKISECVCDVQWLKQDVKKMIQRRLVYVLNVAEHEVWNGLFSPKNFETIWEHTDGMPREVIRLAVGCVKKAIAEDHLSVTDDDISSAIRLFSEDRLYELGSQYQYTYPALSTVVKKFNRCGKEFDIEKVREIAFEVSESASNGDKPERFSWATTGFDDPLVLARSLLDCGFLLIKDSRISEPRAHTDEDLNLLTMEQWYAIHPMYRAGLGYKHEP